LTELFFFKLKAGRFWDSVYRGRVSVRLCHVAAAAFRFISATGARAQKLAVRVNAVIPAGSTQTFVLRNLEKCKETNVK